MQSREIYIYREREKEVGERLITMVIIGMKLQDALLRSLQISVTNSQVNYSGYNRSVALITNYISRLPPSSRTSYLFPEPSTFWFYSASYNMQHYCLTLNIWDDNNKRQTEILLILQKVSKEIFKIYVSYQSSLRKNLT